MALVSTHDSSESWTNLPSFGRSVLSDQVPIHHIDHLIGRKLSAPPDDLSRVLYIPRHDCNVSHLPLYNISDAYSDFVGSEPIGGSNYKIKLSLLRKPEGDGRHEVGYLVNFFGAAQAVVERRCLGDSGSKANLVLSRQIDGPFTVETWSPDLLESQVHTMSSSFPLPDRRTPNKTVRFPFYTTADASVNEDDALLQWQMDPEEHGCLRYTLVERLATPSTNYDHVNVKAIYHHAGLDIELPPDYSHGVVLLPANGNPEDEAFAVASLLGVLWQSRRIHAKRKPSLPRLLLDRIFSGSASRSER